MAAFANGTTVNSLTERFFVITFVVRIRLQVQKIKRGLQPDPCYSAPPPMKLRPQMTKTKTDFSFEKQSGGSLVACAERTSIHWMTRLYTIPGRDRFLEN